MHDIICPNCGERFLGNNVSFDMSEYVLPLLYSNQADLPAVKAVKFKFYVDEDMILNSNKKANPADLECVNHGGPGYGDTGFPFRINGKAIYNYIREKTEYAPDEFNALMEEITKAVDGKFRNIAPLLLEKVSVLYHILFDASERLVGDISIDDEYVQTAMKVLAHLYSTRLDDGDDKSLVYGTAIYSSEMNGIKGYRVPDILFVKRLADFERINKCCCFCGEKLPAEFGYYKMKPVVLLGSHSAGKTSYLLSLLDAVESKAPFVGIDRNNIIEVSTLNEDQNLIAFRNNITRYRAGLAPNKTDFRNVPVLNLKVGKTIYSFIDWPGEKFITGEGADPDYVFKSKRVINHARHLLFFIPPEQIDGGLEATEENVCFDLMTLSQSLRWHIDFPNRKKVRSMSFVINKVDKLKDRPNSIDLFNAIYGKSEVDFYNGSGWNEQAFHSVERATMDYICSQYSALFGELNKVEPYQVNDLFKKHFMPVSPYGYDAQDKSDDDSNKGMIVHRGYLSGLPFLRILRDDAVI